MNTCAVVIKPVRLHCALLFPPTVSLFFLAHRNTHAFLRLKDRNRLERQRGWTDSSGYQGFQDKPWPPFTVRHLCQQQCTSALHLLITGDQRDDMVHSPPSKCYPAVNVPGVSRQHKQHLPKTYHLEIKGRFSSQEQVLKLCSPSVGLGLRTIKKKKKKQTHLLVVCFFFFLSYA